MFISIYINYLAFKRSPSSRAEQTSHFLSERMNEYRTAALQAKKNNDIELAKKYIRIAKVFNHFVSPSILQRQFYYHAKYCKLIF